MDIWKINRYSRSKIRELKEEPIERLLYLLIAATALGISLWVIYYSINRSAVPRLRHAILIYGTCLFLLYLRNAAENFGQQGRDRRNTISAYSQIFLALLSMGTGIFVYLEYFRWLEEGRLLIYTTTDLVVGAIIIFLVTDATFRAFGNILGSITILSIAYGLFGQALPGFLQHNGLSITELIARETIALTGVFGFLMQIGATWIAIFIIFAGLVDGLGGFQYIKEIGESLSQRSASGTPQIAVVSSMFMGTMMGSSASNVATTGSFTIPLMKDRGIPGKGAAAVESIASTGGQILPPIMGTAAFIMADILGIQYATVALGAAIPALLFYISVVIGVHYKSSAVWGLVTIPEEENGPGATHTLEFVYEGVEYFLALLALVYLLLIAQYSPMDAGLYTIGVLLLVSLAKSAYHGSTVAFLSNSVKGLVKGAYNLAPFVAILGSLGIVINIVAYTGLSQRIAIGVLSLTVGLWALLILTMLTAILFGLGLPTPAAYVLIATILGPALVEAGIDPLSAHMFLFYFALLSSITPPVAVAVAIAIEIAKSNFIESAVQTLKLGSAAFFIPYIFLSNPEIIHLSFPISILIAGILIAAVWALILASVGYNSKRRLTVIERIAFIIIFIACSFAPNLVLQMIGAGIFVVLKATPLGEWLAAVSGKPEETAGE